ncbi:MAG: ABC transporter ATP-binding protein [Chloroflexi bacterium]|nr:ABC transporter ATP-binding protein [Chloroflexota bacterium]
MTRGAGGVQHVRALDDVTFEVRAGEFVSILGPSGCGKTTTLRILAGLADYTEGAVTVHGARVTGPGRDRAVVFQQFNLFPWKTVLENAEFGLKLQGVPKAERRERTLPYLRLVGLTGFERHYPHQLSGGMQQRVGIARALATNADILLMDEPFASIDAQTRELLQDELLKILEHARKTVVFITHSIDEAVYLSDRVLVFRPRPGAVAASFDVALPKPRYAGHLRAEPRFVEIREAAWAALRAGIIAAEGEEVARVQSTPGAP